MLSLSLLLLSFFAGVLTVLAPCVLPILPVIISGSVAGQQRWRALVVTASLAASVVAFTLLLKVSTLFINIPQGFWSGFSAFVIGVFGASLVWPDAWTRLATMLHIEDASQQALHRAGGQGGIWGAALLGAALGPVFSSCSPTYFLILATILPASLTAGVVYLVVYAAGLFAILLPIAYFGQRLLRRLRFAANPYGGFRRGLGVLLLVVAAAIATGVDKRVESYLLNTGLNVTRLEQQILNNALPADMQRDKSAADDNALPVLWQAPELAGLGRWINSEPIASMADLRGKVVLVDFWTYSCINCIRTLPYLQAWHEAYADQGLVIIGVHTPEFQFEKNYDNVVGAAEEFGLTYPIVQDNDFNLWRAYKNRYWPAKYLIDQDGNVRYTHFGEGDYEETEAAIRQLLGASGSEAAATGTAVRHGSITTPEIYLGTARRGHFAGAEATPGANEWAARGSYTDSAEYIIPAAGSSIVLRFGASKANMVLGGQGTARVLIDGAPATADNAGADAPGGLLTVDGERLYELADFEGVYGEHVVEIIIDSGSVEAYTFTFG